MQEEATRDAFIGEIYLSENTQRLLEDNNFTLRTAHDKAHSLETAQEYAERYHKFCSPSNPLRVAKLQMNAKEEFDKSSCPSIAKEDFNAAAIERCTCSVGTKAST